MGIQFPAEFELYAIDRFRGIIYTAVKTSLKTNSPIPTWAEFQVIKPGMCYTMNRNSKTAGESRTQGPQASRGKVSEPKMQKTPPLVGRAQSSGFLVKSL